MTGKSLSTSAGGRLCVIGAGAIGLAIAWRAAQAGADVHVFDRRAPTPEGDAEAASWAAAGMLAADFEAFESGEDSTDFLRLCQESRSLWGTFAAELEEASGVSVDYQRCGAIGPALTLEEAESLQRRSQFAARLGVGVEWVDADAARTLEPGLTPAVAGAVYAPDDGQVDNRRLLAALAVAAERAGARIYWEASVASVSGDGEGYRVTSSGEGAPALFDQVVVASGDAAADMELPFRPAPVFPVKGQMLAMPLGAPAALRLVVRSPDAYLAPKASGRLVVGATVEPNQTSRSVDGATLDRLRAAAAKLAPALRGAPVQEAWAGLRPCTPDNAPILGRVCEDSDIFFALGHYRNGILLTPITADLIVGQALRGVGAGRLAPFAASRSSLGAAVT